MRFQNADNYFHETMNKKLFEIYFNLSLGSSWVHTRFIIPHKFNCRNFRERKLNKLNLSLFGWFRIVLIALIAATTIIFGKLNNNNRTNLCFVNYCCFNLPFLLRSVVNCRKFYSKNISLNWFINGTRLLRHLW